MTVHKRIHSQPAPGSRPDLDLVHVGRVLLRNRFLLLKYILVALLLATLFLVFAKRQYRADAQMQLLNGRTKVALSEVDSPTLEDSLQLSIAMQTYVGVLTSDTLALRVIDELKLENTPEFGIHHGFFSRAEEAREKKMPVAQTRVRRAQVLSRFKSGLTVSAGTGSRLLGVGYLSTSPELAEKIVSQLVADFLEYNYESRDKATKDAAGWLAKQLVDLKQNVERTQVAAAELQRKTGIYGTDGSHNVMLTRLDALNQELIGAEQNRIVKEGIFRVVEASDPEAISNLSGNAGQASSPGAVNSMALIQTLRQEEASLSSRLAELRGKFGTEYPRIIETTGQLADVRRYIAAESSRLTERARNDYGAAVIQENTLRKQFNEQKQLAVQANDLTVQYLIASRDANSSRELYEHLLEKLKELDILSGMHTPTIDVIDPAHVGAGPASPNAPLVLGAGFGLGAVFGLFYIFVCDSLEGYLYDPDAVQRITGRPLLGSIPLADLEKPTASIASVDSTSRGQLFGKVRYSTVSSFMEAFRAMRTSMLRLGANHGVKVIMMTSARRSEGKSTITANLARVLELQGLRVLIIDADLRTRGLTVSLGFQDNKGLSDLLMASGPEMSTETTVHKMNDLDFMPAGSLSALPSELLLKDKFQEVLLDARTVYDYVLIDTAPLNAVTDALDIARCVDAVVLVCRAAVTNSAVFTRAVDMLEEASLRNVGTVLNAVDTNCLGYTSFYGRPERIFEGSSAAAKLAQD